MADKVKIGFIGCGDISRAYVKGCRAFDILDLTAVADLIPEKAESLAAQFQIPRAISVQELLADPEIDIVVNLTVPMVHAEVSRSIIQAGKHVYSEKPLAVDRADGRALVTAAREAGLRIGCAPDTFLGGGLQTCRKIIDEGWIGEPIGATAFMISSGPESWHPNPGFFYQPGGGPLFDMGPYYLTALIHLLGPVGRATGSARISFPERVATSEALYGQRLPVSVPTHTAAVLDFESGPVAVLVTSFDVQGSALPRIEVYGSQGTLSVPDPNNFGGPVRLMRAGSKEWFDIPLTHPAGVSRGIGVADMAYGLLQDRPHRANGDLAYHVLDIMQSIGEASSTGRHLILESRPPRPEPLPMGTHPRWPLP